MMKNNWNLDYLVKTEEQFQEGLNKSLAIVDKLATYQGKLHQEKSFKEFFLLQLEFVDTFYLLYQFAALRSDLNKKDVENAAALSMAMNVIMKMDDALSFSNPEILEIGHDKVKQFISNNPELSQFAFDMERLFRKNEHVLNQESESLLANFTYLGHQGESLYSSLAVADSVAKTITLSNGTTRVVSKANFISLIADCQDATDRQLIFETVFNDYEANKNTYASIYESVLQRNKAIARIRKYDSILESFLFQNNIPTTVYTNLVEVASTCNEKLKEYILLRKKYLGLEQYHTYDRFLNLGKSNKRYEYDDAKAMFFDSIKQFPNDFQEKAQEALKEGFVDVDTKDGKRTGAYSSSMPNLHPYILLNYENTLDDVFTVAHEAGHSMHSLFASSQPTNLQEYTIFVAEIASTFNEHVLLDYMMKKEELGKEEKIVLLQKSIDNIIGTFYRQALFAQYELEASKVIENDQPINYKVLSDIMIKLYKQYYDIDITKEKVKEYVWAYIPHLFYTPFYVYQYATSFAASFKIYKDVCEKKENAFEKYIDLLKSGGSKYPIEQAKEAGVDFTTKDPYLAVVERMEYLVNELKKVLE